MKCAYGAGPPPIDPTAKATPDDLGGRLHACLDDVRLWREPTAHRRRLGESG